MYSLYAHAKLDGENGSCGHRGSTTGTIVIKSVSVVGCVSGPLSV